ncbi:hypothetical protein BT69DRAFT_1350014 [Atractiella rhizophila]|nr:hypothetical protein BT69DRAFT_1350014 [Atractiella rhizophila]
MSSQFVESYNWEFSIHAIESEALRRSGIIPSTHNHGGRSAPSPLSTPISQTFVDGGWELTTRLSSTRDYSVTAGPSGNKRIVLSFTLRPHGPNPVRKTDKLCIVEMLNLEDKRPTTVEKRNVIFRKRDGTAEETRRRGGSTVDSEMWTVMVDADAIHDKIGISLSVCSLDNFIENGERQSEELHKRIDNYLNIFNDPLYSDTVFTFPNKNSGGKEMRLFASSKLLVGLSNYFQMMFESDGFAESLSTAPPPKVVTVTKSEVTEDDSDVERDVSHQASYVSKTLPRPMKSYKFIPIPHTCYSTYKAVLYYLFSSTIEFAPLSSLAEARRIVGVASLHGTDVGTTKGRKKLKRKRGDEDAVQDTMARGMEQGKEDIVPVSPKSVFKIAHAYEMESLKAAALQNIAAQLTPHNVLLELLSNCSNTYEEIRDVHIRYLVKHWASVRSSPVMLHVVEEHGVLPFTLFQEVMDCSSKLTSEEREKRKKLEKQETLGVRTAERMYLEDMSGLADSYGEEDEVDWDDDAY